MEGIIHFSCFRLSPSLVQLPGRKYMQYPEIFLSSYGPVMTVPETSGFSPADVFADTRRAQGRKASPRADSPQKEKDFRHGVPRWFLIIFFTLLLRKLRRRFWEMVSVLTYTTAFTMIHLNHFHFVCYERSKNIRIDLGNVEGNSIRYEKF
ncbi:hypothetical protein I7I50_11405 [Histoplasma capsulatum G186AR]|uniref:Uncharacterized protein n=1 Tax=Ajellomyces capsulatus TaxID=5037 RepID=A0A8H7Z9M5_AJECA|nr:hypothetical protein I7I52_02643 [Histoplasma capsulatum]QSS69945.1 hypothetical protein I7I50_11405 [Histoplasma capsulatum G186AR]